MLEDLRHCKDPVRIDLYLKQMSDRLGVDKQALQQKLNPKAIVAKPREPAITLAEKVVRQLPQANFKKDDCFYLLAILLSDQGYVAELEEQSQHLAYPDTPTSRLLQKLLSAHQSSHEMALHTLTHALDADENHLLGMANALDIAAAPDILRAMFYEKVSRLRKPNDEASIKLALKRATAEKDRDEVRRLTQELQKLQRPPGIA